MLPETLGTKASVSDLHKQFKGGREDMKDTEGCGRLKARRSKASVEKVWRSDGLG
jgi:hypothetical protein